MNVFKKMIKIERYSKQQASVYEHLKPIADALINAGNESTGLNRWGSSKEGFVCYLKRPIDFELVKNKFQIPDSIVLSQENDCIACRDTWATIYGDKSSISK